MARSTTPGARVAASAAPARRRLTRRAAAVTAAVVALAGLAACGGPEPVETPAPVTVTPTIEANRTSPPEPEVPSVWPLTGVESEDVVARPAVSVKVENSTSARPQSGLDVADVVWETVVEFEVSRLVAVFHSRVPEEVGPIRSVRPMDPAIIAPYGGVLAFSGGQSGILAMVRDSGVQNISHDAGAPGLYRVSRRAAPHNVYGDVDRFIAQADSDHDGPPGEQFAFALRPSLASAVVEGEEATQLAFRLSAQARPSWTWDSGTGTWLRSEAGVPATVAGGTRISAVNVVSITAPHPNTRFRAQGGARVPTYELVGEGPAVVATGGSTVEGTWRKEAVDAPMRLFLPDGEPLLLAPGNTWVELVPQGSGSLSVS